MHPHQKFGIPTSKNIGDMHQNQSEIGAEGLVDGRRQGQCNYYMPPKSPLGHKNSSVKKKLSS